MTITTLLSSAILFFLLILNGFSSQIETRDHNKENIVPNNYLFPFLGSRIDFFSETLETPKGTPSGAISLPYEDLDSFLRGQPSIWRDFLSSSESSINTISLQLTLSAIKEGKISFPELVSILAFHSVKEKMTRSLEGGHGKVYFTQTYAIKVTNELNEPFDEFQAFQKIDQIFKRIPPQGFHFCLPQQMYAINFEGKIGYHSILIMRRLKEVINLEEVIEQSLRNREPRALEIVPSLGHQLGRFQSGSLVYSPQKRIYKVLSYHDLKIENILITEDKSKLTGNFGFTLIDAATLQYGSAYVEVVYFLFNTVEVVYEKELNLSALSKPVSHSIEKFFYTLLKGYFQTITSALETYKVFSLYGQTYIKFREEHLSFICRRKKQSLSLLNTLLCSAAFKLDRPPSP